MLATLERQGCRQSSARRLWPTGVGRTPESISNIERGKRLPYIETLSERQNSGSLESGIIR